MGVIARPLLVTGIRKSWFSCAHEIFQCSPYSGCATLAATDLVLEFDNWRDLSQVWRRFGAPISANPANSQSPQIRKPGWLARFKSVGWMRLHRSAARTGDKVRLVVLWPVSVSRTALASRQSGSTGEGRTRSAMHVRFHRAIIHYSRDGAVS